MTYISHARTAEEMRREVITDLNRRIDSLAQQRIAFGRGAMGKARFDGKILVLEDMLRYWTELQLVGKKTQTKAP